jgi:hypothetical protein
MAVFKKKKAQTVLVGVDDQLQPILATLDEMKEIDEKMDIDEKNNGAKKEERNSLD